jgi:hypothetical protein
MSVKGNPTNLYLDHVLCLLDFEASTTQVLPNQVQYSSGTAGYYTISASSH